MMIMPGLSYGWGGQVNDLEQGTVSLGSSASASASAKAPAWWGVDGDVAEAHGGPHPLMRFSGFDTWRRRPANTTHRCVRPPRVVACRGE